MIASRFPFWRTNPAGFAVSGVWPVPTGVLAVLFIPLLLGFILHGIVLGFDAIDHTSVFSNVAAILIVSPIASWIPMLVAVPISGVLARTGYAGWGVAAIGGAIGGFVMGAVMNGSPAPTDETLFFAGIGILLALIYWGAIRAMHPTAIGVPFRGTFGKPS